MALDVKIIIDVVKPIGNIGFGCPLILIENAATEKIYAEYESTSEVVTGGFATTTDAYKAASLMFMQDHAPEKIAICATSGSATTWLGTEANVSKSWRQLVVLNDGDAADATAVSAIMTAIEAQTTYPKYYYANLDYDDDTTITTTGIERTLLCYYTPTDDVPMPVAAIAGEVAGLEVGSYTLNNLIVTGVEPMDISATAITTIHNKGGVTIVLSAGDAVVSEGKSAGGSYVDDVDGNDYIKQQLEYKIQKVFNNNLKVPYTDAGIAMLESAAINVMTDVQNMGIVDSYTVNFLLREEVSDSDRAIRKYVGGSITYSMQGAIHEAEIYCQCNL